jgi:signal transduction histidine kinase
VRFDPAALRDEALARSVEAAMRLALANAQLQADVAARVREVEASRRRLVVAGDAERRRLREQLRAGAERELDSAGAALDGIAGAEALRDELARARADLRRFALGIHPPALTEHGLGAALRELAEQSRLAVTLTVAPGRFPPAQESAAYFVCAECLTNVAKYAPAARVSVAVSAERGRLRIRVGDDGGGGADTAGGSGLRGLADRVEAVGGRLRVDSPAGVGTRVEAELAVP